MGSFILRNAAQYYQENGRVFDSEAKRFEYNPETFEVLAEYTPVMPEKPLIEESMVVLGTTREELEAMALPAILSRFGVRPKKGFTKEKWIDEILGATE